MIDAKTCAKRIQDNLKYYRCTSGFTQQQVAEVLSVDRTAYASYELGKSSPSVYTLCKLALLFSVTLNELVDFCHSESKQSEKQDDERGMLFKGETSESGYVSKDERYMIMLYRLCKDKNKFTQEILKFIQSEVEEEEFLPTDLDEEEDDNA